MVGFGAEAATEHYCISSSSETHEEADPAPFGPLQRNCDGPMLDERM